MLPTRRNVLRWGFRAGTALAYFADRDLGARRRSALLGLAETFGGRSRAAPLLHWLRRFHPAEPVIEPGPEQAESGIDVPSTEDPPEVDDPEDLRPGDDLHLSDAEDLVVRALRAVEALTDHRVVGIESLERIADDDGVERGWTATVTLGHNGDDAGGGPATYRVVASADGEIHAYTEPRH